MQNQKAKEDRVASNAASKASLLDTVEPLLKALKAKCVHILRLRTGVISEDKRNSIIQELKDLSNAGPDKNNLLQTLHEMCYDKTDINGEFVNTYFEVVLTIFDVHDL